MLLARKKKMNSAHHKPSAHHSQTIDLQHKFDKQSTTWSRKTTNAADGNEGISRHVFIRQLSAFYESSICVTVLPSMNAVRAFICSRGWNLWKSDDVSPVAQTAADLKKGRHWASWMRGSSEGTWELIKMFRCLLSSQARNYSCFFWARTRAVPRSFSIGELYACAGGLGLLKFDKNSSDL